MRNLILSAVMLIAISTNAQDTANMENLTAKGGLYYFQGSEIPFTGLVVTNFSNGKISSLTNYTKGLKSGKIQIFYDSGKLRVTTYENEKSENYGELKVWNEDGSSAFDGKWINGKLFKEDGTVPFSGKILVYYINGKINETVEFIDGWWNGKQIIRDRNGNILSECIFKNNKIVDCKKL